MKWHPLINRWPQMLKMMQKPENRRGAFMVLAAICLVGVAGFVALSVDLGVITLTKANLQKTADAAALAAAQEIIASVETAADNTQSSVGGAVSDINSIAIEASKEMARKVAEYNGVYINPNTDVAFGRRVYNEDDQAFEIEWGSAPYSGGESYNVVKVTCRRDNPDLEQPDGMLQLFFAPVGGHTATAVTASAIAFVEARDIVTVLDFSGSMSYDSQLTALNSFGREALEANIEDIYNALQPLDLGEMTFAPQWLTIEGPDPQSSFESKVVVTFKDKEVYVTSTKEMKKVTLYFDGNGSQQFSTSGTQKTFKGTDSYYNKSIYKVKVEAGIASATVSGQPASGSKPHIDVIFLGTSIQVTSTKDLSNVVLEYSNGAKQKFDSLSGKTGTFAGTGYNSGRYIVRAWVKSGSNSSGEGPGYGERFENPGEEMPDPQYFEETNFQIRKAFGLNNVSYPYQSGSWDSYINYAKSNSAVRNAGYKKKYGGLTFVDYLLSSQPGYEQTNALWKTPHYPFHAMKNGMSLFLEFLDELDFGDHVGLVTYDSNARIEKQVKNEQGTTLVDLGEKWITDDYTGVDTIQRRKQAGHYDIFTGLGYGMETGIELLTNHRRPGSRPTMLIMTDGQANRSPDGWSLPQNWDWSALTDYDGNGQADYTTNDRHKQYAFYQASLAIAKGYTLHTLSVGEGADRDLMRALAFAGGGEWINVPGGTTIAEVESQMLEAFARIAANVPPAKLLHEQN